MIESSDKNVQTGAQKAPGACTGFQHMATSATKSGLLFLRAIYLPVGPLSRENHRLFFPSYKALKGSSCKEKMKQIKLHLSAPLIATLQGEHFFSVLSLEDSLSLAAAVSSITKSLPTSCDCMGDSLYSDLKKVLTAGPRKLPEGYIAFAREVVRELFPRGIKPKKIERQARNTVPPLKSTTTAPRCCGGSYASWHGRRDEYCSSVKSPDVVHEPEFMIAGDAGKPRALVKNHHSYLLLRPLHKVIYDRLSEEDWLLRGEPTPSRLDRAGFRPRERWLSADFVSATDNIPTEVAEAIIDELAFLSPSSLSPLFSEARKSLRPTVTLIDDGPEAKGEVKDSFVVSRGQLMGNLLSFPLLCLQNHISSEYVSRLVGETPAKLINGDDLVVQCSEKWEQKYRTLVPQLGLELNEKKTSYTSSFLTINSTYFTRNLVMIPFVRCGALSTRDPRSVAEAVQSLVRGFSFRKGSRGRAVHKAALRHFEKVIRTSKQTLKSLGFRFKGTNMVPRALWRREKKHDGGVMLKKEEEGFHQKMVKLTDTGSSRLSSLVKNKEIAEIVVRETWELGPYQRPERMKMSAAMKFLRSKENRCFRTKEHATQTRKGLLPCVQQKSVVVPSSLEECLTLCHERSFLQWEEVEEDGESHRLPFMNTVECELCERVEEFLEDERWVREREWEAGEARRVKALVDCEPPPYVEDIDVSDIEDTVRFILT